MEILGQAAEDSKTICKQYVYFFAINFFRSEKKSREQRNEFWDFTIKSDLVLVVEHSELHVHRDILCCHSPVFKVMLESDFKEKRMEKIPLPGKTVQQVLEMLNFIYPFGHEINGKLILD